jgi:hypothetical protein
MWFVIYLRSLLCHNVAILSAMLLDFFVSLDLINITYPLSLIIVIKPIWRWPSDSGLSH